MCTTYLLSQKKPIFVKKRTTMKINQILTLSVLALLIIAACSSGPSTADLAKAIETAEAALTSDSLDFNSPERKQHYETAVNSYIDYAQALPEDPKTPDYLFKAAEIQRTLKQFPEAIKSYKQIYDNHGTHAKAAQSLFLMGFSYENDLKDLDKAKALYGEFIEKFPKHELADDVQFSITHLGKTPEEIIKEFEKNKPPVKTKSDTTKQEAAPAEEAPKGEKAAPAASQPSASATPAKVPSNNRVNKINVKVDPAKAN